MLLLAICYVPLSSNINISVFSSLETIRVHAPSHRSALPLSLVTNLIRAMPNYARLHNITQQIDWRINVFISIPWRFGRLFIVSWSIAKWNDARDLRYAVHANPYATDDAMLAFVSEWYESQQLILLLLLQQLRRRTRWNAEREIERTQRLTFAQRRQ